MPKASVKCAMISPLLTSRNDNDKKFLLSMANKNPRISKTATDQPDLEGPEELPERQTGLGSASRQTWIFPSA